MPPPKHAGVLLKGTDGNVLAALNLIEGHIGQAGITIGVERPGAQSAIEILDGKDCIADSLAVGGIATGGTDIFDRLEGNIHDLVTIDSVRFSQGSEFGFVILLEL